MLAAEVKHLGDKAVKGTAGPSSSSFQAKQIMEALREASPDLATVLSMLIELPWLHVVLRRGKAFFVHHRINRVQYTAI